MKKIIFFFCMFAFLFISDENDALASTTQIDDYVQFDSVTKSNDNTITVKYTVKKEIPTSHSLTVRSYWIVHQSSNTMKTVTLNKKKGQHTVSFKASGELIGPQYIQATASVSGGRYVQNKKIKTFGKYPATTISSHTVSSTEAVANHFVITSGILSFKLASKRSPYGLLLNLAAYGSGVVYAGKSLNVVGGYPTPAKGQYIRTSVSYNLQGKIIDVKMWANKDSFTKGVKPLYTYSQTHSW